MKKCKEVDSKPVGGRPFSYQRWALSPVVGLSLVAVIKSFVQMNAICKAPLNMVLLFVRSPGLLYGMQN